MKTITTLLAFFITLLLFQSCSPEEIERPEFKPQPETVDYTDAIMRQDSVSNGEEIDPPVRPKP